MKSAGAPPPVTSSVAGDVLAQLGRCERAIDLAVERRDRLRRRSDPHHDAEKARCLVVLHAGLGQSRQIGKLRHAPDAGMGERAQLAGVDVCQRARDVRRHHLHVVAQQPDHGWAQTLERHVRYLGAGRLRELLHREMREGAVAGRAIVELAGLRFGVRHKLGDGVDRHAGVDDQDSRHGDQQDHRYQITLGVVWRLVAEDRIDVGVGAGLQQSVAVSRRLQHRAGAGNGGGARFVLDDDGLLERLR